MDGSRWMVRVLLTVWMLASSPLQAAVSFSATVDRPEVRVNESFWLVLRIDGTRSAIQPDLTVLNESFEVLRSSTEQSMSSSPNGMQSSVAWRVELMARSAGDKVIPAFEQNGVRTEPIKIQVLPTAAISSGEAPAVFVEVELDKPRAYVGEQLVLRTRLFSSLPLTRGELTEPAVQGVSVERLGDDLSYVAQRNGKSYEVIERRYALFATQSGQFTISPVVFRGQTPVARRGNRGLSLFEQQRTISTQSDVLPIEVLSPPTDWAGAWLPASNLNIEQDWVPQGVQFKVGEPITRTVRVTVIGGMPERFVDPSIETAPSIHAYPEKPQRQQAVGKDGLVLSWTQSIALVPSSAGEYQFPEISIPWWRTGDGSAQVARLPAQTVTVMAALVSPSPQALVPAEVSPQVMKTALQSEYWGFAARHWAWATALAVALWMVTLLLWWRWPVGIQRRAVQAAQRHESMRLSSAVRALSDACQDNNLHAAMKAWRQWAQARWPNASNISLLKTAERLGDQRAADALLALDQLRYGNAEMVQWDGMAHWQEVRHILPLPTDKSISTASSLPALYPENHNV